jgi:uncharacterized protein DUF2779
MSGTITKSAFLKGRQCSKRLWLWNQGVEEPQTETDEDLWDDREAEGALVESYAEQLFSNRERIGAAADDDEEVERRPNWLERVSATQRAMDAGKVVVQAHLIDGDLMAIADVLDPRSDGWYLWEVKASTYDATKPKVKAIFDWDLAYQVHVARACGLKIVGAGVLLIDKHYVKPDGDVVPEDLILKVDRTSEVEALQLGVAAELSAMREVLARGTAPRDLPRPQCKGSRGVSAGNRPSDCGHYSGLGECGKSLPKWWAGYLPRLTRPSAVSAATDAPNVLITDLDPDDAAAGWNDGQKRVIRVVQAGSPDVDAAGLQTVLDAVEWPVTYTDFEFDTGVAVPRFAGFRPYGRVPFQWAMVVQETPGGELVERTPFLHMSSTNPDRAFAESFLNALPESGSIVVHYRSAERTVLNQLCERLCGDIADRLMDVIDRLQDSLDIAKAGYLHPEQIGSYSIKKLAPAIIGRGYDDLDISDGMAAVVAWRRAIDPATDVEERERIRGELLQYCGRDAELMHDILEELRRLANWQPPV